MTKEADKPDKRDAPDDEETTPPKGGGGGGGRSRDWLEFRHGLTYRRADRAIDDMNR